jgi:hypothetical protein
LISPLFVKRRDHPSFAVDGATPCYGGQDVLDLQFEGSWMA